MDRDTDKWTDKWKENKQIDRWSERQTNFDEPEGGEKGNEVSSQKPEKSVASRPKRNARKPKKFDDFV